MYRWEGGVSFCLCAQRAPSINAVEYVLSQEPLRLTAFPHRVRNALYYDGSQQAALALTDAEQAQQVAGPPRSIRHSNTRFTAHASAGLSGADTPSSIGTPSSEAGAVDAAPSEGPGRGYSVLSTPNLAPGAGEESPFMTWGDIESTPLRLGDDDMPEVGGDVGGPNFRVLPNRKKDELGRRMALHAGAALKRRAARQQGTLLGRQAAEAAAAAAAGLRPPSTAERLKTGALWPPAWGRTPLGSGATPLSVAGQRLVHSIRKAVPIGGAAAADRQLRASYRIPVMQTAAPRTGTPGHSGWNTPRLGVASSGGVGGAQPELLLQRLREAALAEKAGKLTDDLLDFE